MSEKESKFMNILTSVLGSFILAIAIGMFVFYRITIVSTAVQDVKIETNANNIETMRLEIRQDLKEIKMNIDKIAESQARNSINYITNQKN